MVEEQSEKARIVLTIDQETLSAGNASENVGNALESGAVAAVILPRFDLSVPVYGEICAKLIPIIQESGAAALLDGLEASQIMGRLDADGLLIQAKGENWVDDTLELLERVDGERSIGVYGNFDRDSALSVGDIRPDLIHFGPLARDIKPEPHAKNIKLAEWWAQMIEVPCLIPAGNSLETLSEALATRAEFVVLSKAVFSSASPSTAVNDALTIIEQVGPVLEFED